MNALPVIQHATASNEAPRLQGLRAVFINMPLRESARPNTPPEGPALLAARLREAGADVSIIDLNAYRIQDEDAATRGLPYGRHLTQAEAEALIQRHFQKHGAPRLIALSGMITTLRWQERIATFCRRMVPDAKILSGGGLATELKGALLRWIPALDAIGHSEGDDIILAIGRDVLAGTLQPVYAGDRPVALDRLPLPAWDLLHTDVDGNPLIEWYIQTPVWGGAAGNSSATSFTMTRSLTTVSSRGCPYACSFCYRGAQGERNWGMRSAEALMHQAALYKEMYGIDFLGFPDDNFAIDRKRIAHLPETLGKVGIRWGTHTRLDEADDRLEPMAKSGCVYIGFGAESASKPVLTRMKKGGFILKRGMVRPEGADRAFPKTMVDGIENCLRVGIHANCTWIMAYPGETLEDLQTSISFILWQQERVTRGLVAGTEAHQIALASINRRMFTATAYPGTDMFTDPDVKPLLGKHFGIRFDDTGEPVADEALRRYIEELDDATKVLHGTDGQPLNASRMSMDTFLTARALVDAGNLEAVLDLKE